MSTRADHVRLLRQGSFPVPADVPALTAAERDLLVGCGFWLEALASGALTPISAEQERFIAVTNGRAAPVSEHERAWVKLRPPVAASPQRRPAAVPTSISAEDELALRRVRSMLARGEVSSGFADSVLRQWEEKRRVTPKQLAAIRRLLAAVDSRSVAPRVTTGGSRKPGSHRSSW
jgi:uncharacterized protein YifE (UPF0438 family)